MKKALFDEFCCRRLQKTLAVCEERGNQYGDTWRECQFLILKSVFEKIFPNIEPAISQAEMRALACAALVDIKYIRFLGGYKEDNLDDGINYMAVLAEIMKSPELTESVNARILLEEEAEALRS